MQRILGALRAAHRRAGHEWAVPDAAFPEVADGQHVVVGRHGNAVRERTAVHHLAQNAVARILVHGARVVGHARSGTGSPGIGEEQIALGIEIEVVGAFEQLVAVGIDQRADLLRLRVVDQDAAVPRRQVELAVVPPRALRLAGLTEISRRVAVEHRDQLAVRGQVGDPAAADRHEPQIALGVERAAFEELTLRRVADVGEFFHWADACRQWRQAPRLHRGWGSVPGRAPPAPAIAREIPISTALTVSIKVWRVGHDVYAPSSQNADMLPIVSAACNSTDIAMQPRYRRGWVTARQARVIAWIPALITGSEVPGLSYS